MTGTTSVPMTTAGPLTGVAALLRAYLRRDRWVIAAWAVGVTLLYYSQAAGADGLYRTRAEFERAAASMEANPAFIAMAGPARALDTLGGQVAWQAGAFGAICVALMSMFLIGRHTRAEEESGRDELLRASAVAGSATTTAAVLVAAIANLVVGTAVAAALVSYPLPVADSLALGVGVALTGLVFTGVALVAVQLTATTRAGYGLTGAVIALAYLVRAVGDIRDSWLSWLSPIGVYQGMHAFSGLRWWPALLLTGLAVASVAVGYWLRTRRDFGAGLTAARPGPARAGRGLVVGGLGLAWRLQRGQVVGWAVGMFLAGLSFGSMGTDIGDLVGDGAAAAAFTGGSADLVAGFYSFMLVLLAVLGAAFSTSSALRAHAEEDGGRVDQLLATALTRRHWLAGQVTVTVAGTVLVFLASGVGVALGLWAVSGVDDAWDYLPAMLGHLPAALVLAGLARLCHGLLPGRATVAWLGVIVSAVVLMFGELLELPRWVTDLSPFSHLALAPLEPYSWPAAGVLLLLAAALSVAGQAAFARRDLR